MNQFSPPPVVASGWSESFYPRRAERLSKMISRFPLSQDFPLLKSTRLRPDLFLKLRNAVDLYLYDALSSFYKDRTFELGRSMFDTAATEITGLPNITPNGLILPKRETYLSYNLVHSTVAEIFADIGLVDEVESLHAPMNIRLVNGRPDPAVDGRPRASAKWHSDLWAGEPAGAIMVFLPVFGEAGKIGIRWVEPRDFPERFQQPLRDFDEGAHLALSGVEYEASFDCGDLLLADPYVIHATQKDHASLRLSIDFRLISRHGLPEDDAVPGTRRKNYLPYAEWADIGTGRVLTTNAHLKPYEGPDEAAKNDYAADFQIKKI